MTREDRARAAAITLLVGEKVGGGDGSTHVGRTLGVDQLAAAILALVDAELSDMPTFWDDPAGKGYPCFERRMTPKEAADAIDNLLDRVEAADAAGFRRGIEAAAGVAMANLAVVMRDYEDAGCARNEASLTIATAIRSLSPDVGEG